MRSEAAQARGISRGAQSHDAEVNIIDIHF